MKKIKNTQSTHPLDLPNQLREEYSIFLVAPLTDIINSCFIQQIFPKMWKREYVTPIPKVTNPTEISQLRKISLTSDFSKLFENILKDMILQDAEQNFDLCQYGGRKGVGTEHLIVTYIDRILKLLDSTRQKSAVISAAADWASAFDRIDPTSLAIRLISIGIRESIIPILISYISDRQMIVRFKNGQSDPKNLIGGSPQGTILGGIKYIIASFDCTPEELTPEDKFRYFDDLNMIEFIILTEKLKEYDFTSHIPSDILVNKPFLPTESVKMQSYLDKVSQWTEENKMLLNENKSNYIIFTRSKENFSTRLFLNESPLERVTVTKMLGVWLQEDLGWEENTKQICRKAYARVSLLTKLKYIGISTEDLLTIYILFIRSLTEYCSVAFHSSLTVKQSDKIEAIQKNCLKIILDVNYVSYSVALEMCGLEKLSTRRAGKQLSFSLKCLKNDFCKQMFPENVPSKKEKIVINFARTATYFNSAIPQCQRTLNAFFSKNTQK